MNYVKINKVLYDVEKLTFEDYKMIVPHGDKRMFEKLTGKQAFITEKKVVDTVTESTEKISDKEKIKEKVKK